jgi:predicted transcriptional regulator
MSISHTVISTVKLEPDLRERLQKLGRLKDRTAHWLMKEAIARYVAEEEGVEQLKQETISRWQEAESGKVVSNAAVMTWLETWGTDEEMGRP